MPTQAQTSEERFWNFFVGSITRSIYLEQFANHSERIDRWLNGILALTSSASIATWAIWQQHPMVWGGIIAGAQIIQAIKPILPYKTHQKQAMAVLNGMETIILQMEEDWSKVLYGQLRAQKVDIRLIQHKSALKKLVSEQLKDSRLPQNSKLQKKADEATLDYFRDFWGMNTLKLERLEDGQNEQGNP